MSMEVSGAYSVGEVQFADPSVRARSNAWVCDRLLAGIAGSNPTGDKNVSCKCSMLSGRCLCLGPITREDESYRVWCVRV